MMARTQVVIVMEALKEFSIEPLEWVLMNVSLEAGCTITLLGVMPWLNIPLTSKTWLDPIWSMNLEELLTTKEKSKWESSFKYLKVQQLIDLCQKYGVVPRIRTEMGYPLRLLVLNQITSINATLVVFDRHHNKKNIEYYAKKVPCVIVIMNTAGRVDMFKGRSHVDEGASIATTS